MLISLVSYAFEDDAEAERDDGARSDFLTLDGIAEPRALWAFEGNVSDRDIIQCRSVVEHDYLDSHDQGPDPRKLYWKVIVDAENPRRTDHRLMYDDETVGKLIVQRIETGFRP